MLTYAYLNKIQHKNLMNGSSWTQSSNNPNEYYYNINDLKFEPLGIFENNSSMPKGSIGNLSLGEYGYGDVDNIGFNTIYVRLFDDSDPNSKPDGWIKSASEVLLYQKNSNLKEAIIPIQRYSNEASSNLSNIRIILCNKNDVKIFSAKFELPENEYFIDDKMLALKDEDKIYIMSTLEDVSVIFNIEEISN